MKRTARFTSSFATASRRGFTLTEILVVVVIIVLILGIATPALRFITGSRSQAGASNLIAATLARARNDAIGLQTPTGVCFYTDASSGRTMMAEVQPVQFAIWSNSQPYPVGSYVTYSGINYVCFKNIPPAVVANPTPPTDLRPTTGAHWSVVSSTGVATSPGYPYLFDQVFGTDAQALPSGVGAMVTFDPGQRTATTSNVQDRYVHTGVILFSADGRLVAQPFWVAQYGIIGTASGFNSKGKDVAQNGGMSIPGAFDLVTINPPYPATDPYTLASGIGLATYDLDALASQNLPAADSVIDGITYSSKSAEDDWMDKNGQPLLINRYNGTLLRSE